MKFSKNLNKLQQDSDLIIKQLGDANPEDDLSNIEFNTTDIQTMEKTKSSFLLKKIMVD